MVKICNNVTGLHTCTCYLLVRVIEPLVYSGKYNNTWNTISFSVSKISFIFLMTPIDLVMIKICVELFKATFTH